MKNKLIIFSLLLFTTGMFAETGKLSIDLNYNESGGSSTISKSLISYYSKQAEAMDLVKTRLMVILNTRKINGTDVVNLRISDIMDENGKVESMVTYDERSGSSNLKYFVKEFYDPKAEALNSVMTQIENIKNSLVINGTPITNLKIGEIKDLDGRFIAVLTFNEARGSGMQNFAVEKFYDPKSEAKNSVMTQIQNIKNSRMINGTLITNLAVGEISDMDGRYSAILTYNEAKGSGKLNYLVEKFYDPRSLALNEIMVQLQTIKSQLRINGTAIKNLKVGEIKETSCEYSVELTYNDNNGLRSNFTIEKFIDPKAAALNSLMVQLSSIKSDLKLNGTRISNLKIGNLPIVDCIYVQAFPAVNMIW